MFDENCIFCKIVKGEVPSDIVFENDKVLAFKDINPKAEIHYLIIPKNHIVSIASEDSPEAARDLIEAARLIAEKEKIQGYKLLFNVGREGGQVIDHLHLHFLSGKSIEMP